MSTEASDIRNLLKRLGENDPTCRVGARLLDLPNRTILDVCYGVIEQLATEKSSMQEMTTRLLLLAPSAPIVLTVEKAGLPKEGT